MNIPYAFRKCTKCGEWLVASTVNFCKDKRGKYGLESNCKKCKAERHKQWYEKNKEHYVEYQKQHRNNNKEYYEEYHKQYYDGNRDKILEQHKQYRDDNRDKILEQHKQYYENNKEYYEEYRKHWYKKNKDNKRKYNKQYCKNNKEYYEEYHKQYYESNKDKILEQHKQYRESPQGRVAMFNGRCRRRLREQNQGIGITKEQWLECMIFFNWKCAYSGQTLSKDTRSIDHIKPLNQGGEHEIWNLVPMYGPYNSSKYDKNLLDWYQEQDFYSEERLKKIYEWQEYAFEKYANK